MSDKQPRTGWLAGRREKQRVKRERTGDSAGKVAQRHTSRGRELELKDRAPERAGVGFGGGVL